MPGLDDVHLDPDARPPGGYKPDGSRPRSTTTWLWVILILVAVGIAAYFWWARWRSVPAATEVSAPVPAEVAAPQASEEDLGPLPPLDASDALVRELAQALSSNPDFTAWLATEGLVRRATVVVDNVAEGVSPARHLGFAAPTGRFAVEEGAGGPVVAEESFRRYDRIAGAVAAIDVEGAARLYRRLEPLFDQAYRDLGYPDRRFRETLAKAIGSLLAVPAPPGPIAVESTLTGYHYRDPRLEGLTAAQKQLLRMGPDNVRRVQDVLRRFAAALGLQVE